MPFKIRFLIHKFVMFTDKKSYEMAIHFNRIAHNLKDMKFNAVDRICRGDSLHFDGVFLTKGA